MIPELLYLALDFYREPRRFDHLRHAGQPLPPGVTELLAAPTRCLANDQIAATAAALHASEQECIDCVPFFIKQVMLEVPRDYYRILGLEADAPQTQVKEHYFYLMRLFHPDRDVHNEGWDDLYAPRINEAYNTLRNAAKRAEYDASLSPPDGFNPEQLSQGVQPSFTPSPASKATASKQPLAPGFLRSPWFYALLAGVFVLVLFGILLGSNQTTQLTVTQVDTAQESGRAAVSGDSNAFDQGGPSKELVDEFESEPRTEPETLHRSSNTSDEDIEALVRAKVNQATVAVLGRPRPKAKARTHSEVESDVEPKAPAQTVPESLPDVSTPKSPESSTQVAVVAASEPKAESVPAPIAAAEPVKVAPIEMASASLVADEQAVAPSVQEPAEQFVAVSDTANSSANTVAEKVPQISVETAVNDTVSMSAVAPTITAETVLETASAQEPVKPADARDSSSQPAAHGSVDAPAASAVLPTAEPEQTAFVSNADVEALLSQFAGAYEAGDAARFARYFAVDARTTDANGRPAIENLYAGFFAETHVQAFDIEKLKIKGSDALERDCRASVRITTRPGSGGELTEVATDIRFDIGRDSQGALQITRMRY